MQVRDSKYFVYMPTFGFVEVLVGEIIETKNHKRQILYQDQSLRDQTILNRLQQKYPGCTIRQEGEAWVVNPKDEE